MSRILIINGSKNLSSKSFRKGSYNGLIKMNVSERKIHDYRQKYNVEAIYFYDNLEIFDQKIEDITLPNLGLYDKFVQLYD